MLAYYLPRQRVITDGGRRLVCRPPSVHTVALALHVWQTRIAALLSDLHPETHPSEVELVGLFLGDERAAAVLATCCELHGAVPGETEEYLRGRADMQARAALAVLELCDPASIVRALGFGSDPSQAPEPERSREIAPDAESSYYLAVARAYHVSPLALADWPYDAFLAAGLALAGDSDATEVDRAEQLASLGIPVVRG